MSERFLIFERDSPSYHCGLIAEGVRHYFREGEHRLTYLPVGMPELDNFGDFKSWQSFALVCWLQNSSNLAYIRELEIPYINLCEGTEMSNVGLEVTFEGEGRIAAEFFIEELGMESLAFVGREGQLSHQRRHREFTRFATEHGCNVDTHFFQSKFLDGGASGTFVLHREQAALRRAELCQLLRGNPRPMGIFCADDRIALNLYYLAQHLGIQVPEEVSILGVGSLQRAEEGGVHSISVVQMDHIRQGFCAAQLMERYLTGTLTERSIVLFPDGIVHRSTTTRRAVKDELVRRALEIIAQDGSISVNQLSARLNVSRDTLRNHFLAATNMNVAKAIDLERFHRAKHLLRSHKYSHEAIASIAGYRNHKQMIRSFDRFLQMSPKQFARTYLRQ